jgi:hypothetical protein
MVGPPGQVPGGRLHLPPGGMTRAPTLSWRAPGYLTQGPAMTGWASTVPHLTQCVPDAS